MNKLLKNKLVVVGIIVVVVLGIIGGGTYYLLKGDNSEAPLYQDSSDINVKPITADEIGLVLTPTSNGKQIKLEITKLAGIDSIEYDVSYDAEVTDEGQTAIVSRGVSGSPLKVGTDSKVSRVLDLGTCSRNVCKYDKVVGKVTFTIRVNYKDGTVGGIEEKVSLD